jgi:hypothetical protein
MTRVSVIPKSFFSLAPEPVFDLSEAIEQIEDGTEIILLPDVMLVDSDDIEFIAKALSLLTKIPVVIPYATGGSERLNGVWFYSLGRLYQEAIPSFEITKKWPKTARPEWLAHVRDVYELLQFTEVLDHMAEGMEVLNVGRAHALWTEEK